MLKMTKTRMDVMRMVIVPRKTTVAKMANTTILMTLTKMTLAMTTKTAAMNMAMAPPRMMMMMAVGKMATMTKRMKTPKKTVSTSMCIITKKLNHLTENSFSTYICIFCKQMYFQNLE